MRIISLSKFRFLVKNNFKWKTHYHNISEYNYNDKISCFHFSYISVDKFIIKFKKDKVQVCLKRVEKETAWISEYWKCKKTKNSGIGGELLLKIIFCAEFNEMNINRLG